MTACPDLGGLAIAGAVIFGLGLSSGLWLGFKLWRQTFVRFSDTDRRRDRALW